MDKPKIPTSEFKHRIKLLQDVMKKEKIDGLFIYGDEYRKENLRYVSNYWPMFERGALLVEQDEEPILLCAPEGEQVAREMSVWPDIRLLPDFLCITVPDPIEYPLAKYTDFKTLSDQMRNRHPNFKRLGIVGIDAISYPLYHTIDRAFSCQLVDCNHVLYEMRRNKSESEISCLEEAARIADGAYEILLKSRIIGKTEIEAAAIIEGAARSLGAEEIIFNVFGSGARTNTIIGRPTNKIIEDGDMVMCALAIQYEGYVATCEVPFAVGNYSEETKKVIDILIGASAKGIPFLRPGVPMKNFVSAVKQYFKDQGVSEFDVYPPLHGIGCAEAESPYPHEKTEQLFEVGMTVNTDISLFGLPQGANRIEEGFVITEDGARSLSPFVHTYCQEWLNNTMQEIQ